MADTAHPILLSGHMDTVFPEDSPFNAARLEGDRLHGPGTCDMKGGLVVAIFAALALREVGLHLPLRFLFSPDEEKSSVVMRERLFAEADGRPLVWFLKWPGRTTKWCAPARAR